MENYFFKDMDITGYELDLLRKSYNELRERMIFMLAERFKGKAFEAFDFVSWDGEDEVRMDHEMKHLYGVELTKEDKRILTMIKKSNEYYDKAKESLVKALLAHDESREKKDEKRRH